MSKLKLHDRYQKVVETAPSSIQNRRLISLIIDSALRMARSVRYCSLGTFEFLVSPRDSQFYFMEINPRLQVEHTITESLCNTDFVQLQLLIAQGKTLSGLGLSLPSSSELPPTGASIQLRVTAEDVSRDFSLSIGRINAVSLPGGNGVRVDTYIKPGVIVSHDFDSLLAKIVLTGSERDMVIRKGVRALENLTIGGITTNINLLKGILRSDDFREGLCDLQWLETNLKCITDCSNRQYKNESRLGGTIDMTGEILPAILGTSSPNSGFSFRKGDCWKLDITRPTSDTPEQHVVRIERLLRNDFPSSLTAEVFVKSGKDKRGESSLQDFKIELSRSSVPVNIAGVQRGDQSNPSHLICPISGQLIGMLVVEGDPVDAYEVLAIVRQMKMEIEIRAHKAGIVKRLWDIEPGTDVEDGLLVCEILDEQRLREKL